MHADAERFDPRTEEVFKVLQVISACAMAFSHGANDVANAIGELSPCSVCPPALFILMGVGSVWDGFLFVRCLKIGGWKDIGVVAPHDQTAYSRVYCIA